jgi:hypothetical protein
MKIHGSFEFSRGRVRLTPLDTSAAIWSIVPAPDDRMMVVMMLMTIMTVEQSVE